MAIEHKARSLFSGLPAGIQFRVVSGATVLPLAAVPYELEGIIANWILALPEEMHAEVLHFVDGVPYALTWAGWDAFVSWMLKSLNEAQRSPDFEHAVVQCAQNSLR